MDFVLQATSMTKRKRLSHACNYCRAQKKRCDEQKPSFNKCIAAGVPCITTNPRKPGAPEVERRRAVNISPSQSGPALQLTSTQTGARSPLVPTPSHTGKKPAQDPDDSTFRTPSTTITAATDLWETDRDTDPDVLQLQPEFPSRCEHFSPIQRPTPSFPVNQDDSYRDMHSAVNHDENQDRQKYVGASSL